MTEEQKKVYCDKVSWTFKDCKSQCDECKAIVKTTQENTQRLLKKN